MLRHAQQGPLQNSSGRCGTEGRFADALLTTWVLRAVYPEPAEGFREDAAKKSESVE
jgi:hypothetical protein